MKQARSRFQEAVTDVHVCHTKTGSKLRHAAISVRRKPPLFIFGCYYVTMCMFTVKLLERYPGIRLDLELSLQIYLS